MHGDVGGSGGSSTGGVGASGGDGLPGLNNSAIVAGASGGSGGPGGTPGVGGSKLVTNQWGWQEPGGGVGGTPDGSGGSGGNGRLVLGQNATGPVASQTQDAQLIQMTGADGRNLGTRETNPFVYGRATETPYIPGLVDGADLMGLTALSTYNQDVAQALADAPTNAVAALVRMDQGAGNLAEDWDGFAMLCFVHMSAEPLEVPLLGVGSEGFLMNLMQGGWGRNPLFGGNGQYGLLTALDPGQVYATLIPAGTTNFNMMASGYNFSWQENLAVGDAMYMVAVPEPATLALVALGGLALLRR